MHAASPRHQPALMVQSTVQVGGPTPKAGGRELDGQTWEPIPGDNDGQVSLLPSLRSVKPPSPAAKSVASGCRTNCPRCARFRHGT